MDSYTERAPGPEKARREEETWEGYKRMERHKRNPKREHGAYKHMQGEQQKGKKGEAVKAS